MKILNLYACLGGNRYKWGDEHEITAVELDPELARMYQERFKNDTVIVADAHQYLLDHYKEFDFIWSSPPCPTHSKARYWKSSSYKTIVDAVFPDMQLYQEIIFLQHYFKGKYCVENVIGYYEPLITPKKRGRHYYWTNYNIPNNLNNRNFEGLCQTKNEVKKLSKFHEIDLTDYKGTQRVDKIGRNMVDFEAGKTILDTAMGIIRQENPNQTRLF